MWIGLIQKSNMKSSALSQQLHGISGFALISVLALVSLAAMTATAFLASARLERLATRPLSQTTQLEWALASGEKCAEAVIGDASEPNTGTAKNFVTTLWRGPNPADFTNETGYLLIGEPNATNSVRWIYWAGFSTAAVTNFSTNVIGSAISFTNSHHGTYSNDCSVFMRGATNGFTTTPPSTNTRCTTIELLGGQTSPPVGWVYLTQRKRPVGSLIDVETPVARVAWFAEDLSGKIDAERMGALSANRLTGTNPEEICLTSLIRMNGTVIITNTSLLTNANNRKLYFTPGLLANSSISGLTNTNDLRYFASGLREFRPTNTLGGTNGYLDWIPCGIPVAISGSSTNPYNSSGYSKANLNDFLALPSSEALTGITNLIRRNLPNFTNRAGGMNGTNYALALAANIIDYADADSTATSTNTNGVNIVGFDSYPMLTQVADRFVYSSTDRNITITTYLQFWNPSSVPTPALTGGTFTYNLNDTICYTNSANVVTTRSLTNAALANSSFNFGGTPFSFPPNSGYITSITNTINLTNANNFPNFPTPGPVRIELNDDGAGGINSSATNSFTLTGLGATNKPPLVLGRGTVPNTLRNEAPNWIVTVLNSRTTSSGDFNGDATSSRYSVDPRMLNYIGIGTSYPMAKATYTNTYWGGYPAQKTAYPAYLSGHPGNWPDSTSSNTVTPNGVNSPDQDTPPTIGGFIIPDPAPCKISNFGSYTNICELGNVFDPIQWVPPTAIINYANCDITTNWTANTLYGGGSTLRIGRPEHSLFAFTNFASSGVPIPNMGQSSAALLDLFCVTNGNTSGGPFRTGGKININTAPYPVLAALAGGITLSKDPNQVGSTANTTMINAFATGVMKFRHLYPFLTPSQLLFISVNYGDANWTNSAVWSNAAVFSRNQGLTGVTSINDEGLEEWFSKIYQLSGVSSENYRVYIVAQLVDTNRMPISPKLRKYVNFACRPNSGTSSGLATNTIFGVKMYYWTLTKGFKKTYESPY